MADARSKRQEKENDSEDSELSETEEKNLENILSIFPNREKYSKDDSVDNKTFEKVKGILTCPICLELYKDPVFVRECMHRFCRFCIEKIIRGPNKTCPSCRKPIPTKRELRTDQNSVLIMRSVFKNLPEYLALQEREEEKFIQNYNDLRLSKIKRTSSGVRRSKPARTSSGLKSSHSRTDDDGDDIEPPIVKIRRPNPKLREPIEVEEEDINAQESAKSSTNLSASNAGSTSGGKNGNGMSDGLNINYDDVNTIENLKWLMSIPNLYENMLKNVEFILSFKVEPFSKDGLYPPLESNIFRTSSAIGLKQVSILICGQLQLNEKKYWDKITYHIKTGDKFEILDKENLLSDINSQHWKEYKDISLYDMEQALDEVIVRSYKNQTDCNKILYYSISLEDLIV
jgi:E3 ubiquitin-protein ligase RNF1/2